MLASAERVRQGANYVIISLQISQSKRHKCFSYKTCFNVFISQALESLQRAQELADGMGNKVTDVSIGHK